MNAYYVMDLKFMVETQLADAEFEDHLDDVLDHLHDLDDAIDPDMTVSLDSHEVVFSLAVAAAGGPEALGKALTLIRTAIHTCEGGTPGWEDLFREVEQTVRPEAELMTV